MKIMKEKEKHSIIKSGGLWERPSSSRPKMPRIQRAKQFAPFEALTGLYERLAQAEEEHGKELDKR